MNHKYLLVLALLVFPFFGNAQELNCKVTINSAQVRTQEKAIFDEMEDEFTRFLNEKRWTNQVFQVNERIKCDFIVNLQQSSDPVQGNYSATVQIQSSRPVYDTNYESLLLKFADRNWSYSYLQSQPMVFTENNFNSNLTSMLAFYAYLIVGYDADSFSKLGGSPFFAQARDIVTNAQVTEQKGWKFDVERNRYQISSDLNNVQFQSMREGIYDYHRLAMDNLILKQQESRGIILGFLRKLQTTNNIFPNSILINSFLDAKGDELVSIFSDGDLKDRREAYNILADINPSQISSYKSILEK